MTNGTMDDETMPNGTLQMLRQLLQGAAPADATFTTAKGEGGIQKVQRDALNKLQANQQIVRGPYGHGEVSVRMGAPVNYTFSNPIDEVALPSYQQGMFGDKIQGMLGDKIPDRGNAMAIGSRASDSLALNGLHRRTDSAGADIQLQREIDRLKALKARNSNNPG
jgi:hypothetical protein